jgi:hypothetical protein
VESDKADLRLRSVPPPTAPHPIPANKPEEREEAGPTAPTYGCVSFLAARIPALTESCSHM